MGGLKHTSTKEAMKENSEKRTDLPVMEPISGESLTTANSAGTTDSSESDKSRLKDPIPKLRVTGVDNEANPTLEVALLMDCTSSMSSWITKAKETLNEIIDKVIEECKEEGNLKVRVCFVGYRDISDN